MKSFLKNFKIQRQSIFLAHNPIFNVSISSTTIREKKEVSFGNEEDIIQLSISLDYRRNLLLLGNIDKFWRY